MSDQSFEEEIKIKARKARRIARYMSSTADLVENQILKAQERGDFDNLKGAGKPLHFEENPFEPPELRMAFKILKDHDCVPYWIQLGKDIDAELKKHEQEAEMFKKYAIMFYSEKRSEPAINRFEKKKARFYFEERIRLNAISKKIIDYNLMCPTFRLGRSNISVNEDIFTMIKSIESLIEELRHKQQ